MAASDIFVDDLKRKIHSRQTALGDIPIIFEQWIDKGSRMVWKSIFFSQSQV